MSQSDLIPCPTCKKSGYITELPKEGQADYVLLVNRCYAD